VRGATGEMLHTAISMKPARLGKGRLPPGGDLVLRVVR
jgi:hypothetical protein